MRVKCKPRTLFPFFAAVLYVFLLMEVGQADQWRLRGGQFPWWWDGDHKTKIKVYCCTKDEDFQKDVEEAIKKINDLKTTWQLEKTTDPTQAQIHIHAGKLDCSSQAELSIKRSQQLEYKDAKGNITGVEAHRADVTIKKRLWLAGQRVDTITHELVHGCGVKDTTDKNDKMYRYPRDPGDFCNFSAHDKKELEATDELSSQTATSYCEPPWAVREEPIEHVITVPLAIDLSAVAILSIQPLNPSNLLVSSVTWDSNYIYASLIPTATAYHNEFFWINVDYAEGSAKTYARLVVNDSYPPVGKYPHAVAMPEYQEIEYGQELATVDGSGSYHDDAAQPLLMSWEIQGDDSLPDIVYPRPGDILTIPSDLLPGDYAVTLWVHDNYDQWSSDTVTLKVHPFTAVDKNLWSRYE